MQNVEYARVAFGPKLVEHTAAIFVQNIMVSNILEIVRERGFYAVRSMAKMNLLTLHKAMAKMNLHKAMISTSVFLLAGPEAITQ